MNILDGLRLFFGSAFVLFVPGLAWSFVFFGKGKIDWIERVALSFGLSLALVPLTVFWLSWLFHVKITVLSVSLVVTGLTGAAGLGVWGRQRSLWSTTLARVRRRLRFR